MGTAKHEDDSAPEREQKQETQSDDKIAHSGGAGEGESSATKGPSHPAGTPEASG